MRVIFMNALFTFFSFQGKSLVLKYCFKAKIHTDVPTQSRQVKQLLSKRFRSRSKLDSSLPKSDEIKTIKVKPISPNRQRDGTGKPKGYFDVESRYFLKDRALHSGKPDGTRPYLMLGIETSCDDTGAAVVSSDGRILSNIVFSQHSLHEKFGGIVPSLAMEAHKNNIDKAISEALNQAGLSSLSEIDAVAVTKGPGLEICLRIGVKRAQDIAREYNKPFVTVHHLEAHCQTVRLAGEVIVPDVIENCNLHRANQPTGNQPIEGEHITPQENIIKYNEVIMRSMDPDFRATSNHQSNLHSSGSFTPKINYPYLTLLVSGGHTSILLCRGLGDYMFLGGTLDDALGEAFDKVARILGLKSYSSGGAAVEKQAELYNEIITREIVENYRNSKGSRIRNFSVQSSTFANKTDFNYDGLPPELIEQDHINFGIEKKRIKDFHSLKLNVPMRDKPNCDFSYAGLKNAFRISVMEARSRIGLDKNFSNAPSNNGESVNEVISLPPQISALLCAGFQDAAFQHVEDRVKRAFYAIEKMNLSSEIGGLVVVGGVAANKELRRRLLRLLQDKFRSDQERYETKVNRLRKRFSNVKVASVFANPQDSRRPELRIVPLIFPPHSLCTDNGVMVAWSGIEKLNENISDPIEGQEATPRWPIGEPVNDDTLFKKVA